MAGLLARIRQAVSALRGGAPVPYAGALRAGGLPSWLGGAKLPGARVDHLAEAGDLWANSVVAACLGWLQDNFGQAELRVVREADGPGMQDEEVEAHPLTELLKNPNPFYSCEELWDALITAFKCDGNAYLIKARGMGGSGPPEQLWFAPPWMIEPWTELGSSAFVDSYRYCPGDGGTYYLPLSDVVHLKASPDPRDGRKGLARLKAAVRNVVGLNRAEEYMAAVIGNGGVTRIWVPDARYDGVIDERAAKGIQATFKNAARGESAGTLIVSDHAGSVVAVGDGPEELALYKILDRPEATVCAALGVPAMVVGLAVGDATRTFANLGEADKQAWNNGLIPMQERFATGFERQLLPDFGDPAGLCLEWDRSGVRALQEDANDVATMVAALYAGDVITRDEARAKAGFEPIGPGRGGDKFHGESGMEQALAIAGATQPDPNPQDPNQADPNQADPMGQPAPNEVPTDA